MDLQGKKFCNYILLKLYLSSPLNTNKENVKKDIEDIEKQIEMDLSKSSDLSGGLNFKSTYKTKRKHNSISNISNISCDQ